MKLQICEAITTRKKTNANLESHPHPKEFFTHQWKWSNVNPTFVYVFKVNSLTIFTFIFIIKRRSRQWQHSGNFSVTSGFEDIDI